MKTIITLTLTLFTLLSYSQQQLEFNEVKIVSNLETVPAGKAWKIISVLVPKVSYLEMAEQTGGSCGCGSSGSFASRFYETAYWPNPSANNVIIDGEEFNLNQGTELWIPEGSTLSGIASTSPVQASVPASGCYSNYHIDGTQMGCGPFTPTTVSATTKISVIEFNIL